MSNFNVSRRQFLKIGGGAAAAAMMSRQLKFMRAFAATQGPGLSDPAMQPKFANAVPNALDPGFIYDTSKGRIKVAVGQTVQQTGLVALDGVTPVPTTVWGYGDDKFYTWPGRTFQVRSYEPLEVKWENRLGGLPYLITGKDNSSLFGGDPAYDFTGRSVVDTNLHWAYSLHGYEGYSIEKDGVPIVPHVHGGHTDFQYDGNPEFFFSPGYTIRGPQWVDKKYLYDNSQPAGTVWYHDHALGITRLNVYAGMAGFYIIRDDDDTGLLGNPLDLPAFPYEAAFAIQDKMFKDNGELFYPAFPGDPFYADFITGEGAILPPGFFPGGGPTGLAEFFGDHMVVNGMIWPKMDVEPRNYRLRLLNGCDSRFLVVQFFEVPAGETDFTNTTGPIPFTVIGSDQGLASSPTTLDTLLMETGSRYDIIFDFKNVTPGNRVIMKNIGGDAPFGGDFGDELDPDDLFEDRQTDRIMAFDVVLPMDTAIPDVSPTGINFGPVIPAPTRTRKVALFEGKDEFGRLQPLLGTAEPSVDYTNIPTNNINWPAIPVYQQAVFPFGTPWPLTGPMEGSIAWHSPTTENPALDSTEKWEIWNMTGDAHPVHLHLVHFEILDRQEINYDANTDEDGFLLTTSLTLATTLNSSNETVVVVNENIPASDLSGSGIITVIDDSLEERRLGYTSYDEGTNTFTLNAEYDFSGTNASAGNEVNVPIAPANDGAYLVPQPTVQHNSVAGDPATYGQGFRIVGTDLAASYGADVPQPPEYVENAPKDMVTALPGQITRIKATFDKPGRYVWHCHILSHEDHEMMRVMYVGPGA